MASTVINFIMPYISKYILPILVVACTVLGFIVWKQNLTITELTKELITVETQAQADLALYNSERALSKSTIERQNADIEQYKFDLADYERVVSKKEKELQQIRFTKQEQVNKKIAKDPSANNQLKIVTDILKDFSNE